MFRFAILGLSFAIPHLLSACSCVNIAGSCDRGWNSGDTIFLGKTIVLDKLPPPESGAFPSSYSVRFTVQESFRGSAPPNGEVVVYTGAGGGDCGYPLFLGPATWYMLRTPPPTPACTPALVRKPRPQ